MKIFLIGIMGCGKSYFANKIAEHFGLNSFDLDNIIEQNEGKTIAEIFVNKQETGFRTIETNALKTFANKNNFVLATGGGTACFNNNMQYINSIGTSIWLNENVSIIKKRLENGKNHRPLIANLSNEDLAIFLAKKMAERQKYYAQATYTLSYPNINLENIIKLLQQYAQ